MRFLLQFACPRTDEEIVKLHIQPTVVILSMRVDESVEQYFDPDRRSRSLTDGDGKEPYRSHPMLRLSLSVL